MRRVLFPISLVLAGCTCSTSHGAGDAGLGMDAAPTDARTALDAGHDAWAPPPDGPVRSSCAEAMTVGSAGERCDFETHCVATDLCCSASAGCGGDGVVTVDPLGCGDGTRTALCAGGAALVSGETPHGAIDLTRAWASYSRGFAVDLVLLLGTGAALTLCDSPRVGIWLSPHDFSGDTGYVGSHDPAAVVTMPGAEPALVPVSLDVTAVDAEGTVSAILRADHGGYRFEGEIVATDCDDLDRSGP